MSNVTIRVYESDGSDGYTVGTWGVVVTMGDCSSSDGGKPSRDLAAKRGREMAQTAESCWSADEPALACRDEEAASAGDYEHDRARDDEAIDREML